MKILFLAYEPRFIAVGGLILAVIIGILVWYIPKQQIKELRKIPLEIGEKNFEREEKYLKIEDETRKTLAQIVGGVILIAGLFVTYNTYRLGVEQQRINSRGQITDRFNKAVDHLGNADLAVRLGGLYALEQILKDSPEEHQTIVEVLSAYVREKAKWKNYPQTPLREKVKIDTQTALTILARRPIGFNRVENKIDLSGTNLAEANLEKAKFENVNLSGCYLIQATFSSANLKGATLMNANLTGAYFNQADLRGAGFSSAIIRNTILNEAQLNEAFFMDVKYIDANDIESAIFDYIHVATNFFYTQEANTKPTPNVNLEKFDRESALKYFRENEAKNKK